VNICHIKSIRIMTSKTLTICPTRHWLFNRIKHKIIKTVQARMPNTKVFEYTTDDCNQHIPWMTINQHVFYNKYNKPKGVQLRLAFSSTKLLYEFIQYVL
jgi:hypothetical protein